MSKYCGECGVPDGAEEAIWSTADRMEESLIARIAELEAVVTEVRRLRSAFDNSAGTTVSFGPLWRALDTLDRSTSQE